MTIDTLIMFAGTIVAVLPFIGIPGSPQGVLAWIFFGMGCLVVALGIAVRRGAGMPRKVKEDKMVRSPITVTSVPPRSSVKNPEPPQTPENA